MEPLDGETEGRVREGGGLRDARAALRDLLASDDNRRIVGERHGDRLLPREVQGRRTHRVGLLRRERNGEERRARGGCITMEGHVSPDRTRHTPGGRAGRGSWDTCCGRRAKPPARALSSEGARGASARQLPLGGSGSGASTNSAAAAPGPATGAGVAAVSPMSVCAEQAAQSSGLCAKWRWTPKDSTCVGAPAPARPSTVGANDDTANCATATKAAARTRRRERRWRKAEVTRVIPRS